MTILAVFGKDAGGREGLEKHISSKGVPYPVLFDSSGQNSKALGIKAYPTAFLLDAGGKVIWEGFFNKNNFAAVENLLKVQLDGRRATQDGPDWDKVGDRLGKRGKLNKDGSYKVALLRDDLDVKSGPGMPTPATMGLNSYAAFSGTLQEATVVGDTCMVVHEVNPVIDALRRGGIEVVAIHNHMLTEEPRLIFLHFQGRGDALKLAGVVRDAWDELGKPAPPPRQFPEQPGKRTPDWSALGEILDRPGAAQGGDVYKFSMPRSKLTVRLDDHQLPPGVGLACWAAFYACPCGLTKVMGDTCVTRRELQAALDKLRAGGIEITAIHNHLLGERTEVMFMHFEAEGDAKQIARSIRACWDGLR